MTPYCATTVRHWHELSAQCTSLSLRSPKSERKPQNRTTYTLGIFDQPIKGVQGANGADF